MISLNCADTTLDFSTADSSLAGVRERLHLLKPCASSTIVARPPTGAAACSAAENSNRAHNFGHHRPTRLQYAW